MFKFLVYHDLASRFMGITSCFIQTVIFDVNCTALKFFQNSRCAACFAFLFLFLTTVKIFILLSCFGLYCLVQVKYLFHLQVCCWIQSGVRLFLSFLWYVVIHTFYYPSHWRAMHIQKYSMHVFDNKMKKPLIVLLHRLFGRTLLRNFIGQRTKC